MSKVFIIAEAGVNHNGRLELAKKLVDVAADAGCDAIKFQTFTAEKIVTKTAPKAAYQAKNTGNDESQYEMLKRLELSPDDHRRLVQHCAEKGIMFISTPFDEENVDFLNELGVSVFKIGSGEITNMALIQYIATKNKPIILSTGMSYLGEIEKAILWIKQIQDCSMRQEYRIHSPFPYQIVLLHCVSNYPCLYNDVNLLAIKTMENAFNLPVGYSDHTIGLEASIGAVALGAKVIEKHITIEKNMNGPDHKASLEPGEIGLLVKMIRNIENALGDGIKRPMMSEENVRHIARRSLVAARKIKKGNTLNHDDISIKRPGFGIQPEYREIVVGMRAERDLEPDSVIEWIDLKKV